ncbi:MAG: hypothetical protein PHU51_05590 [Candidatus Nanoarchaeia archaeon]|nr:hypothetical protein [Candidatus Nanoarchaeia archaeon]
MNKNFLMISIALLLVLSTIQAVTIQGSETAVACQCETVVNEYLVCNNNTTTENYQFDVVGRPDWIDIRPESAELQPGECKKVYMFITSTCYADPGYYDNQIVISGSSGTQKDMELQIKQCHNVILTVNPKNETVGQCEAGNYELTVRNNGGFLDEFTLAIDGINSNWVDLQEETFLIDKGAEKTIQMTINPECTATTKTYDFTATATIERTKEKAVENITFQIVDKQRIEIELESPMKAYQNRTKEYYVKFTNTGTLSDEIILDLTAPSWATISADRLSIAPGKTEQILLRLKPTTDAIGNYDLQIKAVSTKFNKEYTKNAIIQLEEGKDIDISFEQGDYENSICLEDSVTQKLRVHNTGEDKLNVELMVEGISVGINPANFVLNPNETQIVELNYDLRNETESEKIIKVTARYGEPTQVFEYSLNLKDCYNSRIELEDIKICREVNTNFVGKIINQGSEDITFTLNDNVSWINIQDDIVVPAKGEKQFTFNGTPADNSSETQYTINASNPRLNLTETKTITYRTEEECFGLIAELSSNIADANVGDGHIVDLLITNKGIIKQNVHVEVLDLDWIIFRPLSVELNPKETLPVYIYIAPPFELHDAHYRTRVRVESDRGYVKILTLDLNVYGGITSLLLNESDLSIGEENIDDVESLITRKVTKSFDLINDGNLLIRIKDITSNDFNAEFWMPSTQIKPGESIPVKMNLYLPESFTRTEFKVGININTGTKILKKIIDIDLDNLDQIAQIDANPDNDVIVDENGNVIDQNTLATTGLFGLTLETVGGIVGIIIILIIIIVIIYLSLKAKKDEENEEEEENDSEKATIINTNEKSNNKNTNNNKKQQKPKTNRRKIIQKRTEIKRK